MPAGAGGTAEEQVEYLLRVLYHCAMPKPNFKDLAKEAGFSSANTAQKKFKAIVEASGTYKLVNNQIELKDDEE